MKLKTLKDFSDEEAHVRLNIMDLMSDSLSLTKERYLSEAKLRQEAIKWAKNFKCEITINFIKHFFNIEESDLDET